MVGRVADCRDPRIEDGPVHSSQVAGPRASDGLKLKQMCSGWDGPEQRQRVQMDQESKDQNSRINTIKHISLRSHRLLLSCPLFAISLWLIVYYLYVWLVCLQYAYVISYLFCYEY